MIQHIKYLSGKPNTFGTHIPVGDLNLKFSLDEKNISGYQRELNLENAITTVTLNPVVPLIKENIFVPTRIAY